MTRNKLNSNFLQGNTYLALFMSGTSNKSTYNMIEFYKEYRTTFYHRNAIHVKKGKMRNFYRLQK